MELIYADANRHPLGQLSSFDIDFDATGEKNFELTIDEFVLKKGYWIFIPDTEIGGIVDGVTVNTADNSIKYIGRNFRGVLNDKIIDVPRGNTYVSAQGEINEVINELLQDAEISDVFFCTAPDTEDVDFYVDYAFEPFCTLYEGLMALAASINFKLIFSYNTATNRVEITPMLVENFTDFLTYTKNSSVDLELQDNAMSVNHFILVGYDENNRYQIDIFINDNSQVSDFATELEPIKDSQYILDNRNQTFFGIDEKTQTIITDKVKAIENYEIVPSKPSNWATKYSSYYKQVVNDEGELSYDEVEPRIAYRLLETQPSDWAQNYASYYTKDGGEYNSVNGVTTQTDEYKEVKKKPKGWQKNYGDYYYYNTDGLTWEHVAIQGNTKYYYKKQKFRPTNWTNGYSSYYQVVKKKKKTTYEAVKPKKKKAPKWVKYKYYTRISKTFAPKFSARKVFSKKVITSPEQAPTFTTNKYYQRYETAPYFTECYKMVLDHYGDMIASLLDDLDVYPVNKQTVNITDFEADIGDVVGGYDETTGVSLSAPILNIIYRIERGIQRSIEYEIGG